MSTLGMVQGLMLMVTLVALFASALGVMTTMTSSVIERRKEIGLMKAVGAERRKIVALFLSEAAIIGALGGAAGFVAGLVLAQVIGISVFATPIGLHALVLPAVMGLAVAVALLASLLPVRRAMGVEPAVVLRGE
jgi:putative ABC transport system permease protein